MVDHTKSTDANRELTSRLRADADRWRQTPTTSLRARVVAAAARQLPELETSARFRFPLAASALLAACIALTVLLPLLTDSRGPDRGVEPRPERFAGFFEGLGGLDEQFTAERERVEKLLAPPSLTDEAYALAKDLDALAHLVAESLPSMGAWVGVEGDIRDPATLGAETDHSEQP